MATISRSRSKSSVKPARKPRPKLPTVETELFFCIGFDNDGSPFAFSADTDRDCLSLPCRIEARGGFRIVRSSVRIPVPAEPTVTVQAVKGGAA